MPTFLVIIIEILVRLVIGALFAAGAYWSFTAAKRHRVLGWIAAIFAFGSIGNIFIPSSYTPGNRITFTHTYTPQQAKAKAKHDKEAKQKAHQESIAKENKIRQQKRAKAIAAQKSVTGLSGLKKQVKKALHNDETIQTYKVSVKGVDTSKPYTANIFLKCTDVSGFKYSNADSDTVQVVKGIKKMHYKDFDQIGIIFVGNTVDQYGNKNKNTPLLKYRLKKTTISKIKPNNIQTIKPIADYYWHSKISDK